MDTGASAESRDEALDRLATLLRLAPGAWAAVIAVGDRLVAGILKDLGERLPSLPIITISFIDHDPDPLVLAERYPVRQLDTAPVLVFRHLASGIPRIFLNLDLKREALALLPHRLVFILSEGERLQMLEQAPNFYSRIRAFFRIAPRQAETIGMGGLDLIPNEMALSGGGRLYRRQPGPEALSERVRDTRIRHLQSRLMALKERPDPDPQKLSSTLMDLADLEELASAREAENHYREAALYFDRAGNRVARADALLSAGATATKTWSLDAAFGYFHEAAGLISELHSPRLAAELQLLDAEATLQMNQFSEAEKKLRKAMETFEDLEDLQGVARSLINLSSLMIAIGRYAEAERLTRRALDIFEKLNNRHGMAAAYHLLGRVAAEQRNDTDQALDWFRKSLSLREEIDDRAGLAKTYHNLANVAQTLSDYEQALEWYRKSLLVDEELGDRAGMAVSYHNLGNLALSRGDHELALDWYRKALAIKEELGNRGSLAPTYNQLGIIAQLRGDHEEALDWYQKSVKVSEEIGSKPSLAISYFQLGWLSQVTGEINPALDWYRKSLAISEEIGNLTYIAANCRNIAGLLTIGGQPAEALPLILRSLALTLPKHDPRDLYWLGRQRELLGDSRFREILGEGMSADSQDALLAMLERAGNPES